MKPIRVLVVEDSPVVAEHLRRVISADPKFEVAGIAPSGEEALAMLERLSPDVISMDIHLPGMQGLEVTRRIMARQPTPIVIVSGVRGDDVPLSMQALQAGALSVVEKPPATTHASYEAMSVRLRTQLEIMSAVKVLRQREPRGPAGATNGPAGASLSTQAAPAAARYRVLGIAASTGGPSALWRVLTGLGAEFPLPIVVVQHMTPAFLDGFAEWLASVVPQPVQIVTAPVAMAPGRVYLAPCDWHLAVRGTTACPDYSPAIGVHRPSANVLFASMAQSLGTTGIGVLLTGMGDDGAEGLKELRDAGSFTIAEHESTATVYGMPAAADKRGAVQELIALPRVAPRVWELLGTKEAR